MQELSRNRYQSHSPSARIELRSGLSYSNLATDDPIEENVDHRILRCQHPRLRAALQFNNHSAQRKIEKNITLHRAPEKQDDRSVQGELGTGAKALIKVSKMVYSCVSVLMSPI